MELKPLFVKSTEVIVAFVLVFFGASVARFVVSKSVTAEDKVTLENPAKVEQFKKDEGLHYDPARKVAYVSVKFAEVLDATKPASKVKDQITYGRAVIINGWDSNRKHVRISTSDGINGFVSKDSLLYELKGDEIFDASIISGASKSRQRRFLKFLAEQDEESRDDSLTISSIDGVLKSKSTLTEFMKILRELPIKPSFDMGSRKFDFAFAVRGGALGDVLLYPGMGLWLSQIRNRYSDVAVFYNRDLASNAVSSKQTLGETDVSLKFSKPLSAKVLAVGSKLSDVSLIGGAVECAEVMCRMMIQFAPARPGGAVGVVLIGDTSAINPEFVSGKLENQEHAVLSYLDLNGDQLYDVVLFSGSELTQEGLPNFTYVAVNDQGEWRLSYIQENDWPPYDLARISPEPGNFDSPVVVRVFSDKNQGIAYTVNGDEPKCVSSSGPIRIVQEAEVLIEKSTEVKIIPCGRSLENRHVLTASYQINNK